MSLVLIDIEVPTEVRSLKHVSRKLKIKGRRNGMRTEILWLECGDGPGRERQRFEAEKRGEMWKCLVGEMGESEAD